jgi:hypothetical protein
VDFVIFGIGTGAALVLIGWLGRDLGPRLRDRAPSDQDEVLSVEELVARVSWARFCGSGGAALALCGAVLLLVTVAALVLRVSDETGTTTMLTTFGLVLVAMAVWSWAYVRRFGVYGVVRQRRRAAPEPEPEPEPAPAVSASTPVFASVASPSAAATSDPNPEPSETGGPAVAAEADAHSDTAVTGEPGDVEPAAPADLAEVEEKAGPATEAMPVEPDEVAPVVLREAGAAPDALPGEFPAPDTEPIGEPSESTAARNESAPTDYASGESTSGAVADEAPDRPSVPLADGTERNGLEVKTGPNAADEPPAVLADAVGVTTSEGPVDEAPVSRRAARRRARAERRDYLGRSRPASAAETERRPAKATDGTPTEGET